MIKVRHENFHLIQISQYVVCLAMFLLQLHCFRLRCRAHSQAHVRLPVGRNRHPRHQHQLYRHQCRCQLFRSPLRWRFQNMFQIRISKRLSVYNNWLLFESFPELKPIFDDQIQKMRKACKAKCNSSTSSRHCGFAVSCCRNNFSSNAQCVELLDKKSLNHLAKVTIVEFAKTNHNRAISEWLFKIVCCYCQKIFSFFIFP